MARSKKSLIPILGTLYLVAFIFFVWGLAAGKYGVFPWKNMHSVYQELHAFFTFDEGAEKSTKEKLSLHRQEYGTKYSFGGLRIRDEEFHDDGYLLISAYSRKHKQVIVRLFSIAENRSLHTWIPPVSEILESTPGHSTGPNTPGGYRALHPLLLEDGGLVFTSGVGPMVRINGCNDIDWVLDHRFHHSLERDHSGNIVACSILDGDGPGTALPMRDDGVTIVSPEGEIINEYSVTEQLLKNGYRGLIYGVGQFEKDRTHLNDAQPVLTDIKDANVGDILLSSRHLSTVALLEPDTGKIKWLKTGPWLNQHDVNILADGRYSIFGNDVVRGYEDTGMKYVVREKSDVYIYDPQSDTVTTPYSSIMFQEAVKSKTQGRSKVLANGDVFVEQTDFGRMLRLSRDKVRWEYVNLVAQNTAGALHWSRYISSSEIDLNWLENLTCE